MFTEQELELYNNDGKYRVYTGGIDKALKNFEYSSEWADLINALGKLYKVIATHSSKFRSVPKTLIVSKRLAQCLHPSLPSGVHIKTLEVYDLIFHSLRGNPKNIFVYATGLFPLLQYAGITVRPAILKIFEDHFLCLGDETEMMLDGLLTGLLNGMEDGGDLNDRCIAILRSINGVVGNTKFYAKLWAVMGLQSTRLPAINYMIQENFLPEDPIDIIEPLMSCFEDTNILVQRSALELINMWDMKGWKVSVRVEIFAGAMGTMLRRDVSLNRRFFSMIKDETAILTKATRKILSHHPEKFRIIMMLFDKPEVSGKILEHILIDIIRALYKQKESEVMQVFVAKLQSSYLVEHLSKQEMTPELTELIRYVYPCITGSDFSCLVSTLVQPKDHMLQLAIELLEHCQANSNNVVLNEYDSIKMKLLELYREHIPSDKIDFEPEGTYPVIEFKFNVAEDEDRKSPIKASSLEPKLIESSEAKHAEENGNESMDDAGIGTDTVNTSEASEKDESTDEPKISSLTDPVEEPPTSNYFSQYDSLDCNSVGSYFGLNGDTADHHEAPLLEVNPKQNGHISPEEEYLTLLVGEKLRRLSDSEQSQEGISEKVETILNDLNDHLDMIARSDGALPDSEEDNKTGDHSRPGSADTYVVEDKSRSISSLSNEYSSDLSGEFELAHEAVEDESEEAVLDRLKAAMHSIIPRVITTELEAYDQPWFKSLLTSCYSSSKETSKQQALNSFLEVIRYIPLKKLRKHVVITKIIESMWEDRNYETLAKFLLQFHELESLIVIKLNSVEEIVNFQEFVLSCYSSCYLDSCVLKLIDNLESANNLIIHASFNCLNEILNKYPFIIIDPIIINLMDKSTKRHYYTEVKSNSTPDLRGGITGAGSVNSRISNPEKSELNPSASLGANRFIHRSTGNLSVSDSGFNVLVYNQPYDNRRIHFILSKLWRMLKFPEFVMKLCIVSLSESPRHKLLGKLVGLMHGFNNSNCNYIHITITCVANFLTSFYDETVTSEDLLGNLEIQVTSCSVLNELCCDLIPLTGTNLNHQSNSFPCYIDSVMKDTKLVKRILNGLLSILNLDAGVELLHCHQLLQFNYSHQYYREITQIEYIKLVTALILLESRVLVKDHVNERVNENSKKYLPNVPILDQPIFKAILVKGLSNCTIHWETLLRKSVGYCTNIRMIQHIIHILCENLTSKNHPHEVIAVNLSALTTILHFVVLDIAHQDTSEMKANTNESSWFNPFTWLPNITGGTNNNSISTKEIGLKHSRFNLLDDFAMILKTIVYVWSHYPSLKPKIINLLNPIALHHMEEFITSTSDIPATDDLVEIIVQLNVIRLPNLTNCAINVMMHAKSPTNIVNMLTLYSKYIERVTSITYDLPNATLIAMIREGGNLNSPLAQNIVLVILNRIMCTIGLQSNWTKTEVKELQEVTQKLLESISSNTSVSDSKKRGVVIHHQDVIIASLNCLSENLHGLLDIVWGSDDKDKLLPILSHMIYLMMTHLRNRASPTFAPTTILLTNLTKYTHLRKAWKKEIFDYLIDPSFFRIPIDDFPQWLVILDNIFSQDKNTFQELIARVTVPTSNSLNIFSSKETEYDNRASLLKRLGVVIYASDLDEYVKFFHSVQERISESLKASPIVIPNIQLNVMLLFRVLLKKVSPNHLTSLWPIIVHEIGTCLTILELELVNPTANIQYNLFKEGGVMDRNWSLLLACVFKLLREANELPVFRMYSWNFTNNIIPHLRSQNHSLISGFECDLAAIDEDFVE